MGNSNMKLPSKKTQLVKTMSNNSMSTRDLPIKNGLKLPYATVILRIDAKSIN